MMARMGDVADAWGGRRVIVELPQGLDAWMPVCEVLVQERLRAWAFAPGDPQLDQAKALYGRRVSIGVHGAKTPQQISDAFAAGAAFVLSPLANAKLLKGASGPVVLGGLTPNELQAAINLKPAAIQVIPADALSPSYASAAGRLFAGEVFLASGYLERFQADQWITAGAKAVALASNTFFIAPDAEGVVRVNLDGLRRRAQEFAGLEHR